MFNANTDTGRQKMARDLVGFSSLMAEAAEIIKNLPIEISEALQVRHYLADELDGAAIMAREAAEELKLLAGDKRLSEMSAKEQDDAKEFWLRRQIDHFPEHTQKHIAFLLSRIDKLRIETGEMLEKKAAPNLLAYSTTPPQKQGVYACRTKSAEGPLLEDKFLLWINGRWTYPKSDQYFRGEVVASMGPLERRLDNNPEDSGKPCAAPTTAQDICGETNTAKESRSGNPASAALSLRRIKIG